MFVKFKYSVIVVFVLLPLLASASNVRKRRRPTIVDQKEEIDQKNNIVPDQIALASHPDAERIMEPIYTTEERNLDRYPPEQNGQSGGGDYEAENMKYLNTAMNAIKAEYQVGGTDDKQLDETETAQEYVEKAMEMYGSKMNTPTPSYQIYEKTTEHEASVEPMSSTLGSVTRSYDIYDFGGKGAEGGQREYTPKEKYEPKFHYQSARYNAPRLPAAAGELPKAEILKQIEKSVIKYMKELEAEGKLTTPEPAPTAPPKIYYKIQAIETTEAPVVHRHKPAPKPLRSHVPKQSNPIKHTTTSYHNEVPYPDEKYTAAENSVSDPDFNQNVEFVYKFRTRPSGSVATSAASQKQSIKAFDHSSALKSIQGFDMSHVVQDNDRPGKHKLYFNADTYHDINSLPYKPEKVLNRPPSEYKKPKEPAVNEYQGYSSYQGADEQYIPNTTEKDLEDDGYPIMNPYQYVLKKEPNSYKSSFHGESSLHTQASNWTPYTPEKENTAQTYVNPQKGLEYDSYSPKYNHNPEGYGYQHNYKNQETPKFGNSRPQPSKRGKRGGVHHKKNGRGLMSKDFEANLALRPPKM